MPAVQLYSNQNSSYTRKGYTMDMLLLGIVLGVGIFIGDRVAAIRNKLSAPRSLPFEGYFISTEHLQSLQQRNSSTGLPFMALLIIVGIVLMDIMRAYAQ